MPIDYQKEPWRGNVYHSFFLFILFRIFSESLFDICASPKICCKGFFCLDCLFGENAHSISGVSCCLYCCGYLLLSPVCLCGLIHMPMRVKMREKYGLQEVPSDRVAGCLCSPCAVCQEAREIISRERSPGNKVRTDQPMKNAASPVESEVASATSSARES
jgi:Cys-rich protein (TIGR01571 family)